MVDLLKYALSNLVKAKEIDQGYVTPQDYIGFFLTLSSDLLSIIFELISRMSLINLAFISFSFYLLLSTYIQSSQVDVSVIGLESQLVTKCNREKPNLVRIKELEEALIAKKEKSQSIKWISLHYLG